MPKQPNDSQSTAVTTIAPPPAELVQLYEAAGLPLPTVSATEIEFFYPTPLDELATVKWASLPKALMTPPMIVKRYQEFPEAEKFEGYKGFIRFESILPDGQRIAWSTHLFNKTTGELGPIAEYIRPLTPPFPIRIGSFETSNPGRRVFRPVPLLEPVLAAR